MHEFCPLCSKRGFKRRIKALQINLHEAVWSCEGEECEWPFGYEDFIYVSREAGDTWSCYWDDFKPLPQAINAPVPVSAELSLYTPPETPAEAVTKDCLSDVQCSDHNFTTNDINNSTITSEVQSMSITDIFDHSTYCLLNGTSGKANIKIGNVINDNNSFCTKTVQDISNIENISKDVFAGTNKLELGSNTSNNNLNKDVSVIKNTDKIQSVKTSDLKNQGNNLTEKSTPSNLKITTVEIDGLPPVILSYEAPMSLSTPTSVSNKGTNLSTTQCITTSQSTNAKAVTTASTGTHKLLTVIKQPSGPTISASKQYAKFSFSAIKKQMQENNKNNSPSIDKCLPNSNKDASNNKFTDQIKQHDLSKNIASCTSINTNISIKTELKTEKETSEKTTVDSSLNIDTLLDNLIEDKKCYKTNEEFISDIDDDWINCLFD